MDNRFEQALRELGLLPTSEQLERFAAFEEALYTANETRNLTRVPREQCWIKHFIDSLLFQDYFPTGAKVLDIGCGPGFPSWPLACAREDLQVVGLDSNGKMLGFLSENLLPNLKVINGRAEDLAYELSEQFDVVTGRAVAALSLQFELSVRFLKVGGLFLPLRTPNDREEAERLDGELHIKLENQIITELPDSMGERYLPVFRKAFQTPKKYPRSFSDMKRKPL